MAEVQRSGQSSATPASHGSTGQPPPGRGPSLHEIYALPAPIRTFPLPTFVPSNPVSLLHLAWAWLAQVFRPPPAEPAVVHHGTWSAATNSVHVTDERSMRALWEQGFYGKGSLSRSEPNWLKREQVRRGLGGVNVSEMMTLQRRQERAQAKWERARLEQEAIRQTKLAEGNEAEAPRLGATAGPPLLRPATPKLWPLAPVGPLELLMLPNSASELLGLAVSLSTARELAFPCHVELCKGVEVAEGPVGLAQSPATPDSTGELSNGRLLASVKADHADGDTNGNQYTSGAHPATQLGIVVDGLPEDRQDVKPGLEVGAANATRPQEPLGGRLNGGPGGGVASPGDTAEPTETSEWPVAGPETRLLKRQKSVRFSPKVESTTFQHFDPPSPSHPALHAKANGTAVANGSARTTEAEVRKQAVLKATMAQEGSREEAEATKEHLQLSPEEAFFLVFGLGALEVSEPRSGAKLSTQELFTLFRQHSYFPPRVGPDAPELAPDDGFLIHYVAYHHFRSLGWVPRAGVKFGVDWLLYARGPVFDHAEFGLMLLPAYSDPYWKAQGKRSRPRSWSWLHGLIRVLANVTKSLVLVYVDVPPPDKFEGALRTKGLAGALRLYGIREFMVKRWSGNRNR